jgi:hypothetical protein
LRPIQDRVIGILNAGGCALPRSLDSSDFRGVRVVLEPSDFALGDDIPEPPPSDLIDKGTWFSIMTLPDDVAIRTSSYHGTALGKLHDIWGALVEAASIDNQDALDAALLDAADDFQGAVFNTLCGFYRLFFTSLRSVVELISIGADAQISGNLSNFEKWRAGQLTITFDTACSGINRSSRLQTLRSDLRMKLSDSLFDPKQPTQTGGWARRLYSALSNYSHSRPGRTDADARQSNGPIYVPKTFVQTVRMHIEVAAFAFIMVKLARPGFALPGGGEEVFLPSHPAVPEIAREVWIKLQ